MQEDVEFKKKQQEEKKKLAEMQAKASGKGPLGKCPPVFLLTNLFADVILFCRR